MNKPTILVMGVDLLLFNLLLVAFHALNWDSHATHWWLMAIMFYLLSVLVLPPFAQSRFARLEKMFGRVIQTMSMTYLLMALYIYMDDSATLRPFHLLAEYGLSIVVLFHGRYMTKTILQVLRSKGRNNRKVVFVGAGHNLTYLYGVMNSALGTGFRVLGYFNDEQSKHLPDTVPYLGRIDEVITWLENHKEVEELYCNLPHERSKDILKLINFCEGNLVHFFSVPNVHNYVHRSMVVKMVDDMPVLMLRREPLSNQWNRIQKRILDIIFSGLFIVTCFWWIAIIVAIITKITMPGPVFFRQKRNGFLGEEFYCLKFRSMKVNADADKLQATKNDPRKTKWGDIMRKTSIDELPQFLNVFMGSMSVVGPRPHMVRHTEEYSALIDKYMVRHWVKPGITGWAQVRGARGETQELWQMEDRIKKDVWYVENWSLWLDIRIVYLTIKNAIMGDSQAY